MHITHPEASEQKENESSASLPDILAPIYEWAAETGRMAVDTDTYRDLLSAKIMGCFARSRPRLCVVLKKQRRCTGRSRRQRRFTDFQRMCIISVRTEYSGMSGGRLRRLTESWTSRSIFQNRKRSESNCRCKEQPQSDYPRCVLCKENVGYEGRSDHPARQNLRVIPVILGDEQWFLQFSPYVYYREHCIVLKDRHEPMKISKNV